MIRKGLFVWFRDEYENLDDAKSMAKKIESKELIIEEEVVLPVMDVYSYYSVSKDIFSIMIDKKITAIIFSDYKRIKEKLPNLENYIKSFPKIHTDNLHAKCFDRKDLLIKRETKVK